MFQNPLPDQRIVKRIFFSSSLIASFIKEDISLLSRHFVVDHVVTRGITALWKIPWHVIHADVTYTWFASVYAFAVVLCSSLLGKRSIIVIGGVDASREPAINYGIWLSPWKSVLVRWAMRNAHKLLVVDPFFIDEIRRLARYEGSNIEYIPTGYDSGYWSPEGVKEHLVLTVAACHDRDRMKKKGLDVLFAAARVMPEQRFVVVGIVRTLADEVRREAPRNVEIVPFAGRNELLALYRRAGVYCQPSFTEGLPNSLCEAMLCECIPVGTNVGGIPTAIADAGFLVPYGDPHALAEGIRQALAAPPELGKKARNHIKTNFTLERRERELLRVLPGALS